jgi:DNA-binding NarL/FixJ family response regulator
MVADGLTQEEIGRELHVSRSGVNQRLIRLRQRIGVRTNAELVSKALREGWIK